MLLGNKTLKPKRKISRFKQKFLRFIPKYGEYQRTVMLRNTLIDRWLGLYSYKQFLY